MKIDPNQIVLSSFIPQLFGRQYKVPDNANAQAIIALAISDALANVGPLDGDVEASLPLFLSGMHWKDVCGALGWSARQSGRVAQAKRLTRSVLKIALADVKPLLVDIMEIPVDFRTWGVLEVQGLMGTPAGALSQWASAIRRKSAAGETLNATDKWLKRYIPGPPSLVDYLLLDGIERLPTLLERMKESGFYDSQKKILRVLADPKKSWKDVREKTGMSMQAYAWNLGSISRRLGLGVHEEIAQRKPWRMEVGHLRTAWRLPQVLAWRAAWCRVDIEAEKPKVKEAQARFDEAAARVKEVVYEITRTA